MAGRELLEAERARRSARVLRVDRRRRRRCWSRRSGRPRPVRGGRARVGARVAREQHELARLVDVHVLVLPERRLRRRSARREVRRRVARQRSSSAVISSSSSRVRRIGQRVRLQPEAPRDDHHVRAPAPVAPVALLVLEEVDRRGVRGLRRGCRPTRRSSRRRAPGRRMPVRRRPAAMRQARTPRVQSSSWSLQGSRQVWLGPTRIPRRLCHARARRRAPGCDRRTRMA